MSDQQTDTATPNNQESNSHPQTVNIPHQANATLNSIQTMEATVFTKDQSAQFATSMEESLDDIVMNWIKSPTPK